VDGFAGLSDARSLATIIEGLSPRALLLLGANAADTQHLATVCGQLLRDRLGQQTRLYQPGEGALVRGRRVCQWAGCLWQLAHQTPRPAAGTL
jgi:hypothetical protein